jgi:hypothetical protein
MITRVQKVNTTIGSFGFEKMTEHTTIDLLSNLE